MFDLDIADITSGGLYKINGVSYKIDQADNTYYIPKHYPDLAAQLGIEASSPEAELPYALRIVDFRPVGANDGTPPEQV